MRSGFDADGAGVTPLGVIPVMAMQRRDEIIEQIFTEDAELFRSLADT